MAQEPFSTSSNLKTEGIGIDVSAANSVGDQYLTGGLVYSSSSGNLETGVDNLPVGIIRMWAKAEANAAPPDNYLICAGQGISSTTYAKLFALIGYKFGGSSGTFNLPRFNVTSGTTYRFPSGVDSGQTESNELNNVNSVSIGSGDNLSHSHTVSTFTYSSTTGNSANTSHSHGNSNSSNAPHTHAHQTGRLTTNAAHSHDFGNANTTHTHSYLRSGNVAANTSNPNTNHAHPSGNTVGNHSHNSANTGHNHNFTDPPTFNAGSSHTHTFSANWSSEATAHTHSVPAVGVYFIIKYR